MTLEGKRVQILHPGFWNREAGPDFSGAIVQFDGEVPRSGDIEIDLESAGWRGHNHDQNPNYRNVVLHVVWAGEIPGPLPTLLMKPFLDAPLSELSAWLASDAAKSYPPALAGQCCGPLRNLAAPKLTDLLQQAALVRLHAKGSLFQARSRQVGWEQSLWEGLFRALGYKKNVWPMQRLAELRERFAPAQSQLALLQCQARVLGLSGLLPSELTRQEAATDRYLRQIWDCWWRDRAELQEVILPKGMWRFDALRPANHPQRRLALAAHWLSSHGLIARIEQWAISQQKPAAALESLTKIFSAPPDAYWYFHWTLRSKKLSTSQPLIGPSRVTDLAVNVVLPWLWIRAGDGHNIQLQAQLEDRYLHWPKGEDNTILRLARQRLLGAHAAFKMDSAALQQGLIQIVRDFCEHSNALCANCEFPELVRQWGDLA